MSHRAAPVNALLQVFDEDALRALGAATVEVKSGDVLQRAGSPEDHAYFPTNAVISLVSTTSGGGSVEVSMVGREGVAGLSGMFAADSPTENIVELGGTCVRVSRAALRTAHAQHPCVRTAFDRYMTARVIQMARLAACHRLHPIGNRLARWLLGLHDRAQCHTFRLSQQRLSELLGAHRPTIATELQRLHVGHGIRYTGRLITVEDRAALERMSCECHQSLHREYLDLVSWTPPAPGEDHALSRQREEMLMLISHELRTPLQAILGWCTLAAASGSTDNAFSAIERNARAQLKVIEEKLDLLAERDGRH